MDEQERSPSLKDVMPEAAGTAKAVLGVHIFSICVIQLVGIAWSVIAWSVGLIDGGTEAQPKAPVDIANPFFLRAYPILFALLACSGSIFCTQSVYKALCTNSKDELASIALGECMAASLAFGFALMWLCLYSNKPDGNVGLLLLGASNFLTGAVWILGAYFLDRTQLVMTKALAQQNAVGSPKYSEKAQQIGYNPVDDVGP